MSAGGHLDPVRLPVAEQWFASRAVIEDLTVLWEPHVSALLRANIWCLRSRGINLVIDSGLGVASLRRSRPDLFGGDCTLVVTHAHLDHMGSAYEFEQCWAHPAEQLGTPRPGTLHRDALGAILGLEIDPATPGLLINALPHPAYDPDDYTLVGANVTRELQDGDLIELPGHTLTVLHLPGHTAGSIALYEPESRALFSGDVVYELDPGERLLDCLHGSDVDAYVASMQRLLDLDVDVVHPGHGESFDGARLRALARDYLRFRTQ